MKRVLSFLIVLTLCLSFLPANAFAALTVSSGTCGDDLTWTLDDEGTLTISGTGAMTDYSSSYSVPWYSNRYEIEKAVVNIGVTRIGNYAFHGCTGLTSMTISDSVTSIGRFAFYDCTSLCNISIPDSVTSVGYRAFTGCTNLQSNTYSNAKYLGDTNNPYVVLWKAESTSIPSCDIHSNTKVIHSGAFDGCTNLKDITIPNAIKNIGDHAFYDCTGLEEINFNATGMNDLAACNYAFYNAGINGNGITVNVGANVSEIPACLFYSYDKISHAPKITTLNFTEGSACRNIGNYAFYCCASLTSITIPDSVTDLGDYAFYCCNGLEEINFNATAMNDLVASNYVFYNAGINGNGIKVNVGTKVARLPAYLFCPDSSLNHVPEIATVFFAEGSVCENIGEFAFYGCSSLTGITIPDSMTDIGGNAFYGCTRLEEINFNAIAMNDLDASGNVFEEAGIYGSGITVNVGANVTRIPGHLFDCSNSPYLVQVIFPENSVCKSIGSAAFRSCTSLSSIMIPPSVTSIGENAFYNCSYMTDVIMPDSVTGISSGAFGNCNALASVTYCGTEQQWNSISILDDNTFLTEATRRYHNWAEASCTEARMCSVCGEKENVALGHSFTDYISDGNATCTADGTKTAKCVRCDATDTQDDPGSMLAHSYAQGICTGCGVQQPCGDNLTWTLDDEGTLTISGTGDMAVFYYASSVPWADFKESIKKVVIQEGVTSIGDWAFSGCTALTEITIPEGVTSVGFYAFSCCKSLTDITLPSTVTSLGTESFLECTGLTEIVIPDGVEWIGGYVFEGCTGLTNVVLPASITEMGANVFNDCTALTDVYYQGTKEQWAAISMGVNQKLSQVTIHYNSVQDIQAALNNADAGAIVTLTQNAVTKYITVPSDVTLDLNGYALNADYFTSYGAVVDGIDGGNALVKVNKGIHMSGENAFLPIYDSVSGGYRFYKYELQNMGYKTVDGSTNNLKVGFRLALNNTAGYSVLSNTENARLELTAYVSWTGAMGTVLYTFREETLRNYSALVAADIAAKGSSSKAITLTISGVDSLGQGAVLSVQPAMDSDPGVTALGENTTWTVQ